MMFSLRLAPTGPLRLSIDGELDITTIERLEPTLRLVLTRSPALLEIDLSQLRMIDSAGVGLLVGFCKRLRTIGCSPVIVGLRDQPLAVFRLLGLDKELARAPAEATPN